MLIAGILLASYQAVLGDGITSITTTVENRNDSSQDYTDPNNPNIRYEFNVGNQNSILLNGFTTTANETFDVLATDLNVTTRRSDPTDNFNSMTYGYSGTTNNGGQTVYNMIGNRTFTPDEAFGGRDLSDGVENVFQNTGSLAKTIERIDYVYVPGFQANNTAQLNGAGFSFFERDANNRFATAAITGVDVNGDPTSFGNIVSFGAGTSNPFAGTVTNYGAYTGNWNSLTVKGDLDVSGDYSFHFANSQDVGGVYLSFGDLGITTGQTIYGYALFADDNGSGPAPVDVANSWYNKNTSNSAVAGGDLYLGGVLYKDTSVSFNNVVNDGRLYWDLNDDTPGSGINNGDLDDWNNSNAKRHKHWGNADGDVKTSGWTANNIATFSAGTDAGGKTYEVRVTDVVDTIGLDFQEGDVTIFAQNNNNDWINLNTAGVFINVESSASADIQASLRGTKGVKKTGDGTVTLSGPNTFTGTTRINGGTLAVSGGSALSDTNNVIISSNTTFELLSNETVANVEAGGFTTLNNNTLSVGGTNASASYNGVISGGASSGLTKNGTGTLTLTGDNTFSGTATVNGGTLNLAATGSAQALGGVSSIDINGGTLLLSQANQINNSAALDLDNGTFSLQDNSETLGSLTLTSTSTIDMGSNSGPGAILTFSDAVDSGTYAGGTLNISNWDGVVDDGGGNNQIIFSSSLSQTFLNNVYWTDLGFQGAKQLATGEIVPFTPIPEPSTYLGGSILAGFIGWHFWRRRKKARADLGNTK